MLSAKTLVCLCTFTLAVFAQTDRGSITGTVSDPAGAVVPNAPIAVKNVDTGAVFQGGTSATGNYVIPVPAGRYELSVTVSGFKKYVRENLTVTVATSVRQDVTLEVGANTDTVTVTDTAPLLKTESGELSHNVTADQANNLPVLTLSGSQSFFNDGFGNIRDPLAVAQLLPGVQFGTDYAMRVNGLPSATEAIRIEGQDATNGMWKQITQINQSGMDAIQEVSIQTSNFAAEFGQAAGGYFNFTMKSGTNQFHGSAYDYFVNEAFNAGLPFTDASITNGSKAGQHIRNAQRRNDYGFTLGGPIRIPKVYNGHDKSFFFFNFEQYRETKNIGNSILTVPTVAYRNGDFSGSALGPLTAGFGGPPATDSLGRTLPQNGVYDPRTTRVGPDGANVRDLFPGGKIPLGRIDPVAAAIQAFIPLPTNGQTVNNYNLPAYSDSKHTTNASVKLDHSLSPTIKISGYVSRILTRNPNNNGLPGPIEQPAPTDNRSTTARVNYDQSLKPTLLLHLGVGYLYTFVPSVPPPYDEASLGLKGYYNENLFPNFSGLSDAFSGGVNLSGGPFGGGVIGPGGFFQNLWDQKPTANASLTWVKNNHTYKFGGEMVIEGFPDISYNRTQGNFGISATSTANPWQLNRGLSGTTGLGYASFYLGQVDVLNISPPTQTKLGNHSFAFFVQDSWKITRKLTLDYGLRYDYETYLKEQYGRMQSGSFNTPNPTVGGIPGAVLYEGYGGGRCDCQFSHNYPHAWGPRLGVAYQIAPKTVFRGGIGVQYSTAPNNAFLSYNVADFYAPSGPGYGIPFLDGMTSGNPFAPGNPKGLAPLVWPNFDIGKYPLKTAFGLTPLSPFISIDRSSRPPRVLTWSIGLQREIMRNLVVEASYVGNRGVWFTAPEMAAVNYNSLQVSDLTRFGLSLNSANDRALLSLPISSPTAIARGFGKPAYAGLPLDTTVGQNIRPSPQWYGVPPFLGPPLGNTWYDSMQIKATKRYSHGLEMQGSFTWEKNIVLGTSADTQYFTPGTPLVNDVFNRNQNRQISGLGRPLSMVISGSYTTPKWGVNKIVSHLVRDWQIGAVLRYQSGALIQTPPSNNSLLSQLDRGPENNPAIWGGGHTFWNRVPGQSEFVNGVDPNCHCIDPTKQLVLNPAAWTDAAPGQFGASAPFYNDNRWQRQPSEAMSLARNFRIGKEGRYNLQIRGEFQNIFNRVYLSAPAVGGFANTNPASFAANFNPGGTLSSGYGFVNFVSGAGSQPRSGQMVGRFTF